MKTLTLKMNTARILSGFYGACIAQFYNLVVKASPEFGVRAPVRLEFALEEINKVIQAKLDKIKVLEDEEIALIKNEETTQEAKDEIAKKIAEAKDVDLDLVLADDKYTLCKKIFEAMGAETIWSDVRQVEETDEKGKKTIKAKRVENLLYFPADHFLNIVKAFEKAG